MSFLERRFGLSAAGTTVRREVIGGASTYLAMAYILFVNPVILANAGMNPDAVFMATALASAVAMVVMGLFANYPVALAPGMGVNALFAFVICGSMGFGWQEALGATLVAGVIFLLLSLVGFREKILNALPRPLQMAIAGGIGLFIFHIGLQWSGLVVDHPETLVAFGSLTETRTLLAVGGLVVAVVLSIWKVPGSLILAICMTAAAGVAAGEIERPARLLAPLDFSALGETAFALSIPNPLEKPDFLTAVVLLFFVDLFDTVGTLVAVGHRAGLLREGKLPRAERAFASDAVGTTVGALLGTSTVTSYIESAAGVAQGARTGLSTLVVALLFVLSLLLLPVVGLVGTAKFVVGPALILVGLMMMKTLREVPWDDMTEAIPAAFAVAMPFFFSITEGIALACIAYVFCKAAAGRLREAPWTLRLVALAFLLRYALL
ncbi:MAG: NCS2 family permease [Planctomycetota bacterium]|jgi:AGZA family xanthine/uracil permease-like MFS transporter